MYESVTESVIDLVAQGFDDEDLFDDESDKIYGPASQHLCLFYKIQLEENFERLMTHMD